MISERTTLNNPYSDVWLSIQKSAEAIVPGRGMSLEYGSTSGTGRAEQQESYE